MSHCIPLSTHTQSPEQPFPVPVALYLFPVGSYEIATSRLGNGSAVMHAVGVHGGCSRAYTIMGGCRQFESFCSTEGGTEGEGTPVIAQVVHSEVCDFGRIDERRNLALSICCHPLPFPIETPTMRRMQQMTISASASETTSEAFVCPRMPSSPPSTLSMYVECI